MKLNPSHFVQGMVLKCLEYPCLPVKEVWFPIGLAALSMIDLICLRYQAGTRVSNKGPRCLMCITMISPNSWQSPHCTSDTSSIRNIVKALIPSGSQTCFSIVFVFSFWHLTFFRWLCPTFLTPITFISLGFASGQRCSPSIFTKRCRKRCERALGSPGGAWGTSTAWTSAAFRQWVTT